MIAPATAPSGAKPASETSAMQSWLPTLVMNIVLPTGTYFVLTSSAQVTPVPALLISGIWPAIELGYTIWRQRRIDEFSVFVLITLALGVLTTVFSHDARAVFMKDWLSWGLFGLVILASMVFGRPLMFYFGRRFATDGSQAQRDWWNGLWRFAPFRTSQRILNAVWGATFFAEAVIGAVLTWRLGTAAMVLVNNILPYVVLFALIFGTIAYGRRARAAAARQHGAAGTPSTAAGPASGA